MGDIFSKNINSIYQRFYKVDCENIIKKNCLQSILNQLNSYLFILKFNSQKSNCKVSMSKE
jgi:hypothetical protein